MTSTIPATPTVSVPVGSVPLHALPGGARAVVASLSTPQDAADRELLLRLIEIGFLPGERVRIIAKGYAGGEPIAVRLGDQSTFALRTREAALVQVLPETANSADAAGQGA